MQIEISDGYPMQYNFKYVGIGKIVQGEMCCNVLIYPVSSLKNVIAIYTIESIFDFCDP